MAAALPALAAAAVVVADCGVRADHARNGPESRELRGHDGAPVRSPRKGPLPAKRRLERPERGDGLGAPADEPSPGPPADDPAPPARPPDESEEAVA